MAAAGLFFSWGKPTLRQKPQRRLIAHSALEEMRLLNRAAAKWSRYKHRALGRQLASRARGCLRLWLSDLRSKHAAPIWFDVEMVKRSSSLRAS